MSNLNPLLQEAVRGECGQVETSIKLSCGPIAHRVQVAYELVGPVGAPLVVVMGGISAHKSASSFITSGWWPDVTDPHGSLAYNRYRLLGIDFLGGLGGSSQMNELAPKWANAFLTPSDQSQAVFAVLRHLGIDSIRAWVGCSFGGMVGLAFAASYPRSVQRVIAISAAERSTPQAIALRWIQQSLAQLGHELGRPEAALSLARSLAMTTYRTPAEFNTRFKTADVVSDRDQVSAYLRHCGERFSQRFNNEQFITLSRAIDHHQVEPAQLRTPVSLIGVREDQLIPMTQLHELLKSLPQNSELFEFSSNFGHDAFLKEPATVNAVIRHILEPQPQTAFRGVRHWRNHEL